MSKRWIPAFASPMALLALAALAGCGDGTASGTSAGLTGVIVADGSSTVFPVTTAVAEDFTKKAAPNVRVTVGRSGTGGGFKKFCAGDSDVSNASRPIKANELEVARQAGVDFIELPIAYDGLTIVVNRANDWCDHLTLDEIRRIFLDPSPVKSWQDVRAGWPDVPVRIFAPGTDSGTFDYFKEVVAGDKGAIRGDMSTSEDDHILVKGVGGDRGGLGFFGCAYYFANQDSLRAVPVDAGKGAIAPTRTTIEDGTYAPFSRPLFIYVSRTAAERAEVRAFVEFYLEHGPELAEREGYVRLPESMYELARANFRALKSGTRFLDAAGGSVKGPLTQVYR